VGCFVAALLAKTIVNSSAANSGLLQFSTLRDGFREELNPSYVIASAAKQSMPQDKEWIASSLRSSQ